MTDFNADAIESMLRKSLVDDDVVPDAVVAEATLIPSIRRLDADIAELTDQPVATRADTALEVYRIDDAIISVEHEHDALYVDVVGLSEARVDVQIRDQVTEAAPYEGRYRCEVRVSGPARIVVRVVDRVIATDWFTIG